ncbi:MAG: type IV pilus secretin PilQ [Gammaproteobacteria bacterium]
MSQTIKRYRVVLAVSFTMLAILLTGPASAAQTITELKHSVTSDGIVRIVATASEAFNTPPASFSIDSPARIVIDIAGNSGLDKKKYEIGEKGVRSVSVVEGNGRTRLVAQLDNRQQYNVTTSANSLVLEIGSPGTMAQAAAPAAAGEGSELQADAGPAAGRLSLNFQDIEVRSVLQLLADFTGLNMVVSDTVRGNITLRLKDVYWEEALDIILQTKGLSKRQRGNVIMVAPTEEVARMEQLEAQAAIAMEELEPLKTSLIRVKYARASELAALIKSDANRLMSTRGNVTVDERTNTLLIHDTASSIQNIRSLVNSLDRPVKQVMVESRIVIASDDFARDLGVRFGFSGTDTINANDGTYITVGGGKPGLYPNDGNATPPNYGITGGGAVDTSGQNFMVNLPSLLGGDFGSAIGLMIGKVGRGMLQLELSAMQIEGKGEIVSSPRVITTDQQEAIIKQGVEIPYEEATSSGATNVTFQEAVLQLAVTPQITPDNKVIMELDVSKDNPDFSREVRGVPPIDTRSVQTTVRVNDGETVVLGGIFEQETTESQDKTPVLGDIPAIGRLFRRDVSQATKRELLLFVTPNILDN